MLKSGIYKITNKVNGMFYIGNSYYVIKRWVNHKVELRFNRHGNRYLQSAWNKYGEDSFEFEVIEPVTVELLVEREQYWLDLTKCYDRTIGYNLSPTASTCLGVRHTDETKAKLGTLRKGKPRSEETKAKIAATMQGRKFSEETRAKMAAAQLGKKQSKETKAKRIVLMTANQINTGRKQKPEHIERRILSNTGKKRSDEAKANISASLIGRKYSEETRLKMSEAAKKRWANR